MTLIQGAWALLLSRYSGEEKVVFGVATSPATLFPLHIPVLPEQPGLAWLTTLQADLDTLRRQLPAWAEAPPPSSRFETLLAFAVPAPADIPLTLTIDEAMGLRCDYTAARFEEAAVTRLLGHLQTLLKNLVTSPEQPLRAIPMLTEAERQQILIWNDTTTDSHYLGQCIHRQFERQAAQTPDAIALVYAEPDQPRQTMTYHELNARANQLARYLRSLGVGPEVPVGMCVTRSTAMIVGMLGILKADGAYVPIDPTYPPDRQAFMLNDTQTHVLLTEHALRSLLPPTRARVICLDSDWPTIATYADTNLNGEAQGHNLAYIIYTSGSTGQPKGVEIAHQSVINLINVTRPLLAFDHTDVWTVFHSYAFDFSVWEIWTPLLSGGRLVIVPQAITQSPTAFLKLLRSENVTIVNQTPSALQRLVGLYDVADPLPLRMIICGGEALPRALAEKVLAWRIPLWNFYGPTESTVWAACGQITEAGTTPTVPIGRPLGNIRLYILDRAMQLVPVGVPGELYIGGVGLARGYFNRPQLTAEKFVRDPFAAGNDARLYKTGDTARYHEDGNIEFLQRLDNQVKIHGFRVEPGEIENTLVRHPAVREAVVIVRPDCENIPRLIAYYTLDPTPDGDYPTDQQPTTAELRDFLKQYLPSYMIPHMFIELAAMPLTPNGKIDRQRLPTEETARPHLSTMYVAPRTETERSLARIWEDVLHVAPVGIHDNFFELGGDSILSLQIIAAAREVGLYITVQQIFEYQTIAALARLTPPSSTLFTTDFLDVSLSNEELETLLSDLGDILP